MSDQMNIHNCIPKAIAAAPASAMANMRRFEASELSLAFVLSCPTNVPSSFRGSSAGGIEAAGMAGESLFVPAGGRMLFGGVKAILSVFFFEPPGNPCCGARGAVGPCAGADGGDGRGGGAGTFGGDSSARAAGGGGEGAEFRATLNGGVVTDGMGALTF